MHFIFDFGCWLFKLLRRVFVQCFRVKCTRT